MPELPPVHDGFLTYVFAGIAAIVSTLATVVAYLYRISETRNGLAISKLELKVEHLDEKLDETEKAQMECEKDRAALKGTCEFFRARIESLEMAVKK